MPCPQQIHFFSAKLWYQPLVHPVWFFTQCTWYAALDFVGEKLQSFKRGYFSIPSSLLFCCNYAQLRLLLMPFILHHLLGYSLCCVFKVLVEMSHILRIDFLWSYWGRCSHVLKILTHIRFGVGSLFCTKGWRSHPCYFSCKWLYQ